MTIEEGSRGGFGAFVLHLLSEEGLLDNGQCAVRSMYIPDIWIGQSVSQLYMYVYMYVCMYVWQCNQRRALRRTSTTWLH